MARTLTPIPMLHIPYSFRRNTPYREKSSPITKAVSKLKLLPSSTSNKVVKLHIKTLLEIERIPSSRLSRLRYRRDSAQLQEAKQEMGFIDHAFTVEPPDIGVIPSKPKSKRVFTRVFTRLNARSLKLHCPKSPLIERLQQVKMQA